MYYAGIDLGSSYTKAVIIDNKQIPVAYAVQKTGIQFNKIARIVFEKALKEAGIDETNVQLVVSTGTGRNNCDFKTFTKPEISCFAKGGFHQFGGPCIIIDIGGQDNKFIKLSKSGQQIFFKMNRKCAAGTGSFLEDIALRLDIKTSEMNEWAQKAKKTAAIGSFCTVFAGTEIIHHIRTGVDTNELMRGVFESVSKRILEMAPIDERVVLTGGAVAEHPVLGDIFKQKIKQEVLIPEKPQFIGALGAALYAFKKQTSTKGKE